MIQKERNMGDLQPEGCQQRNAKGISAAHRNVLDERLKSYAENPENLLEGEKVKKSW